MIVDNAVTANAATGSAIDRATRLADLHIYPDPAEESLDERIGRHDVTRQDTTRRDTTRHDTTRHDTT